MRLIAYYLPQFHTIKENDIWWGKGFTDWVSVRNAKPLFEGHIQPQEPDDELGYYNLLDAGIRSRQAQMAQYAGIEGFCYWHYWFGGKQLLETPFNEVLRSGKPDFPFCLAWANESWRAKEWSVKSGKKDKILIEQTYPEGDIEKHFYAVLPALKDKRYIKVHDKPLFVIYRPLDMKGPKEFIKQWNKLAKDNGLNGMYFVGHTLYSNQTEDILHLGFDAVNIVPLGDCRRNIKLLLKNYRQMLKYLIRKEPFMFPYSDLASCINMQQYKQENIIPTIIPNWDHTPRSGIHGFVLRDSTPEKFAEQIRIVKESIQDKQEQIVFLKSWNEWGEGNYMEPDKRWGRQYIDTLKREAER